MSINLKEALASKQAATVSNTTEEVPDMDLKETLDKKTDKVDETVYEGHYRILNKHATPIGKVGDLYKPKNAEEVECLEYQVKMGRITKRVI